MIMLPAPSTLLQHAGKSTMQLCRDLELNLLEAKRVSRYLDCSLPTSDFVKFDYAQARNVALLPSIGQQLHNLIKREPGYAAKAMQADLVFACYAYVHEAAARVRGDEFDRRLVFVDDAALEAVHTLKSIDLVEAEAAQLDMNALRVEVLAALCRHELALLQLLFPHRDDLHSIVATRVAGLIS